MDLIDRDYLINNIIDWRETLKDENAKKLLTEVIHCIKAKDTIVDMQKLIDGINFQKSDLDSAVNEDVKGVTIYNGAIDDCLYEIKNAINPNYKKAYDWDKSRTEIIKELLENHKHTVL